MLLGALLVSTVVARRVYVGGHSTRLAVLLPDETTVGQELTLQRVLPALELAVQDVTSLAGPLPSWTARLAYRNTECSSVYGPLAAFSFYVNDSADAFLGPGCEYVIAPVARYAGVWGIPVLTAGAQAEAFSFKQPSFTTLTRLMGSYTQAGGALRAVLQQFSWRQLAMLYHNNDDRSLGNSACFLTLSAVFTVLKGRGGGGIPNFPFDEKDVKPAHLKELLTKLSASSRSECRDVLILTNKLTNTADRDLCP